MVDVQLEIPRHLSREKHEMIMAIIYAIREGLEIALFSPTVKSREGNTKKGLFTLG